MTTFIYYRFIIYYVFPPFSRTGAEGYKYLSSDQEKNRYISVTTNNRTNLSCRGGRRNIYIYHFTPRTGMPLKTRTLLLSCKITAAATVIGFGYNYVLLLKFSKNQFSHGQDPIHVEVIVLYFINSDHELLLQKLDLKNKFKMIRNLRYVL